MWRQTATSASSSNRSAGVRAGAVRLRSVLALLLLLSVAKLPVSSAKNSVCLLTVTAANASSLVDSNTAGSSAALVDALWTWCVEDADCREVYHQTLDAPNRTVFRHLLPNGVESDDLYERVQSVVCGAEGDASAANRALWIEYLVAKRKTLAPLCDLNHELRFDADTLQSQCVCRADRVCSEAIYDLIPFYIAIALVMAAGVAIIGGAIYKNVVLVRTLRTLTGDDTSDLISLFNALK